MELTQNMLPGALIVGVLILCLVPIVGGFLHYRRDRLLTHAERMKALEVGRDLPHEAASARLKALESSLETSGGTKSLAAQCYSTTAWVCGCGFVFTFATSSAHGVAYASAAATGAIGVTGMICGTILASKSPESAPTTIASKPRFDPEAI